MGPMVPQERQQPAVHDVLHDEQERFLLRAASEQSHDVGMGADLLHDPHLPQELLLLLGSRSILDRLDGHEESALAAANVLRLGLPHLAKVTFADERLQPQSRSCELPRRWRRRRFTSSRSSTSAAITERNSAGHQVFFIVGLNPHKTKNKIKYRIFLNTFINQQLNILHERKTQKKKKTFSGIILL
jgi:hypothetical protein